MIRKYRNKGLIRLAIGIGLLLFGIIIFGTTSHGAAKQLGGCIGVISAISGYLIFVFGCNDLLKAKGYESSMVLAFVIPAVCCSLAFIFIAPLVIILGLKDKRRGQDDTPRPNPKMEFRRTATLSWICPALGIGLTVICASTRIRLLTDVVALVCSWVIVASLILGVVALRGVRKHGAKGILIPSIIGIIICGVALLFLGTALIAGIKNAGKTVLPLQSAKMTESMGAEQTNTATQSPSK